MDVTRECFFEGLKAARAGNHLNDISKAIGAHAAKYHYGIVRDLVGHGIGTHLMRIRRSRIFRRSEEEFV